MRNKTRKFKRLLAGPYLFWSVSFIIIPLLMIFYYGLTDKDGAFTLLNIAKITTPENLKALGVETCQPQGSCEGAAWLSSARAVRCRLKCHNERNPYR